RPGAVDDRQPVLSRRSGKGAAAHRAGGRSEQRRGLAPIRLLRSRNCRVARSRSDRMTEMPPAARLIALLDHLGIAKAHIATQIPADIAGLAMEHAEQIGGIVLCTPVRLDPAPFAAIAERMLMISGEYGPTFEVCLRAADRLGAAPRYVLDSYEALGWSDVAADRAAELTASMKGFLGRFTADMPRSPAREGNHAGISYRIEGSGPALLLLPFFLAPSQWA